MKQIVVDADLPEKLRNIYSTVELVLPSGEVIGTFTPRIPEHMLPKISEEELRRREQMGGGRPLKDILADFEQRS